MADLSMTGRERVLAAVNHELPDRVPVHVMGFDAIGPFCDRFGLDGVDDLRQALGLDVVWITPSYVGPEIAEGLSYWGTHNIADNAGYSQSRQHNPLATATTPAEVESFPWPSPNDFDYQSLRKNAEIIGERAAGLNLGWEPVFCRVLDLFGMEAGMMAMRTNPSLIEAAVCHIEEYIMEKTVRSLDVVADRIDFYWYGDDFGTQRGMMIRPEDWRRFFAPTYRRLIDQARGYGLKNWFHACGAFPQVMPDLVDMGIDVWETSQVHLAGNNPEKLKREYGEQITFCGGINTQWTLPFGTTEDVRREVRERIAVLGKGGGYICGPDHTVRPEVPVDNVVAMLDEAKSFRGHGYTS
jgi:uroporphyrinogen decarboxylase